MDRVVVLRRGDPVGFVADACAALAESVNGMRPASPLDARLIEAYAELVVAYSRLTLAELGDDAGDRARVAVLEHLTERLRQAQRGELNMRVIDVVDRLHGELTNVARSR